MIPIKLEIQGLYSYREKQTIDFSQLTAAGLFGLFGAVGSGKSSILEGILLALYGSTERLADRGEKNSMVNLQSDGLLIVFEFKAGPKNAKTYVARYSVKRNSKNFQEIRPAEHTFYEKSGDQLTPTELRAEALVGMKKEHFKQTVIIPQGKFREFIDLTPGPRADMMKELFGLERFDLAPRTGSLLKTVREEKIRVETQLGAFQDLTEASLENLRNDVKSSKTLLQESLNELTKIQAIYQQQQALSKDFNDLKALNEELKLLQLTKIEIDQKRARIKEYRRAKTYLKPLVDGVESLKLDKEKYRVSVINCQKHEEEYKKEIDQYGIEVEELRIRADQRSDREAKIRDLQKVLQVQELITSLDKAQHELKQLRPEIENAELDRNNALSEIEILQIRQEAITLIDPEQLAQWKTSHAEWLRLEKEEIKHGNDLASLKKAGQESTASLDRLIGQMPTSVHEVGNWFKSQAERILHLEKEREEFQYKSGLAAHVHLLEGGKPCPLCGSADHPDPLEPSDLSEKQLTIATRITREKERLEEIRLLENRYQQELFKREQLQTQVENAEVLLGTTVDLLASLKKTFVTERISSAAQLAEKIERASKQHKEWQAVHNRIGEKRKELNLFIEAVEAKRTKRDVVHEKTLTLSSALESKREEISDPPFCAPYFEKDRGFILAAIDKVKRDIEETAYRYDSKRKHLQELKEKAARNQASLSQFSDQLAETTEKLAELEQKYLAEMKVQGFSDHETVVDLFRKSLDADAVDAEIQRFDDKFIRIEDRIGQLKSRPGILDFRPDAYQEMGGQVAEKKAKYDLSQQRVTILEQQLASGMQDMETKKSLDISLASLEKRESNLKQLEGLFKGSGFVKYVSSIYLKELCNTANSRFRKLTKNSLSLEIDENNTFWVIDYLNGGKKRLLKTLSGGQTFQASLCLALALAEKVKSLNRAEQSFFFLDEGFGALDKTSLRIVFETLKSLRLENRIVGIISHVEDLQQEIEVYAQVTLDPEAGSQISYSFE
ncbi:Exonuclease SbcC [Lunatimonas lonarensis]|uniref:Exonuclease SbcC n=1 Tax=Lunatimonas lonarensis TaxID=1232681 RepID=R7ZX93_9BACT|nr:SMC family ATPase [Lunatimonas lonarensis]EON78790.1 Exonuclease SbcC [Lunatimonas lonarensis]